MNTQYIRAHEFLKRKWIKIMHGYKCYIIICETCLTHLTHNLAHIFCCCSTLMLIFVLNPTSPLIEQRHPFKVMFSIECQGLIFPMCFHLFNQTTGPDMRFISLILLEIKNRVHYSPKWNEYHPRKYRKQGLDSIRCSSLVTRVIFFLRKKNIAVFLHSVVCLFHRGIP